MKSILVYCGSSNAAADRYKQAARDMGALIAARGWRLIYGGGCTGLMGLIADTVLAGGGEVVGVMPKAMVDKEVAHFGLTKLHIVDDMHQRKAMMMQMADAIVALPGGIGTLEEWSEAITWYNLDYHAKPVGLLNLDGFYDPLLHLLRRMHDEGFLREAWLRKILVADSAESVLDLVTK